MRAPRKVHAPDSRRIPPGCPARPVMRSVARSITRAPSTPPMEPHVPPATSLEGEPPVPQNFRRNARDDVRAKARTLREHGLSYNQIAAELGVSKSSVSLWVRDLPQPEGLSYEECRRRAAEGVRKYWAAERPRGGRCSRRRPDRPAERSRDPYRRGSRLLVRMRQEQAAQARRSSQLHQQ